MALRFEHSRFFLKGKMNIQTYIHIMYVCLYSIVHWNICACHKKDNANRGCFECKLLHCLSLAMMYENNQIHTMRYESCCRCNLIRYRPRPRSHLGKFGTCTTPTVHGGRVHKTIQLETRVKGRITLHA